MKRKKNLLLKVFFLAFTPVVGSSIIYLSTLGYILFNAETNTLQNNKANVAIVLGSTPYWNNQINPCLEARVLQGVKLYKEGKVRALIMSGGKEPDGAITEAEIMKQIAVENGMDPTYVFEERNATSTYENITYSKAGVDFYQAESVVIVTEPYHSPRGLMVGEKLLDQEVYVAPAVDSPCWKQGKFGHWYVLREPVALLYYFVTGKI